jgi:hypothetical protein
MDARRSVAGCPDMSRAQRQDREVNLRDGAGLTRHGVEHHNVGSFDIENDGNDQQIGRIIRCHRRRVRYSVEKIERLQRGKRIMRERFRCGTHFAPRVEVKRKFQQKGFARVNHLLGMLGGN